MATQAQVILRVSSLWFEKDTAKQAGAYFVRAAAAAQDVPGSQQLLASIGKPY